MIENPDRERAAAEGELRALPSVTDTTNEQRAKERTFLGHPIGLYILFFTEMWERFSYYGMRGLLMLYMVNYFRWTQKYASLHYKWYTGLVYLTPLLGGYLADRFLGNKRAVIIGAILMAIGHFLMAFEALPAFYSALTFLILGNGFFKPNMSTQVGRLYGPNDPRRDGAYTIFYMGINLGAFLAPLVCGWLAENTLGEYHSGFTIAGIGMVCALVIYLVGQPWVREIVSLEEKSGSTTQPSATSASEGPISEAVAEQTSSTVPVLNRLTPALLALIGCGIAVAAPILAALKQIAWNNAGALEIGAVCFLISAWITSKVHHAVRDRVIAIYVLGIFVVCFWAAFEQAGNVLNVWADKVTVRTLTGSAPPPAIYAEVKDDGEQQTEDAERGVWERFTTMFALKSSGQQETSAKEDKTGFIIPTTWFQSINALAIFVLAPFFAFMWTTLERRRANPSIPTKMAFGVLLMSLSLAVMVGAARQENQPSTINMNGPLPHGIAVNEEHQLYHRVVDAKGMEKSEEPYHSGRLTYDASRQALDLLGVLPDIERDRIVRDTAPAPFVEKVEELQKKTNDAPGKKIQESVVLPQIPPGFDMKYAGFKRSEVAFEPATGTLTAKIRLADKDVKSLLVAAGAPEFRETLNKLMIDSSRFRVSSWWLFWSYILATLGELCLSPVGLSMVSKLAPARFATMLMGLWLVTSFFGNFVAGAMGEIWDTKTPTDYFLLFVAGLGIAALILFLLVRKVVSMMHGVN
jgi:POT family proton-dependent oligopeptide transporter